MTKRIGVILIVIALVALGFLLGRLSSGAVDETGGGTLSLVGTTTAIGGVEGEATLQELSYQATFQNDGPEALTLVAVEPLLVPGLREVTLTLDRRIDVHRTLAPGDAVMMSGSFRFDPVGRSKAEIEEWEPFIGAYRIYQARNLTPGALADEPYVERPLVYIDRIFEVDEVPFMAADEVQWLQFEAASAAMREAGECPETGPCEPPNNFYVRNADPMLRTIRISPDVEIVLGTQLPDMPGGQEPALEQFQLLLDGDLGGLFRAMPYHLWIENGLITRIEEQYVP